MDSRVDVPHYSTFAPDSERFVLEHVQFDSEAEEWSRHKLMMTVSVRHGGESFHALVVDVVVPEQKMYCKDYRALLYPEEGGTLVMQLPFCDVYLNKCIAPVPDRWTIWRPE